MGSESKGGAVLDRNTLKLPDKSEPPVNRPNVLRAEFRKIAEFGGFSLDYDPIGNLEQRAQARRSATSLYFEKVATTPKQEQPWEKPPMSQQEKEAGWKAYWDKVPLKQKLERQKLILQLRAKGLRDADGLVHFFEREYVGQTYAHDMQADAPKNGYELNRANELYRSVNSAFKDPELIAAYKQTPNPLAATQRLQELGGYKYMEVQQQHEDVVLHRTLLQKLGSIPEDKYRKVVTVLKGHPYLVPKVYGLGENKKLFDIVGLIETGELTPEQMTTLNTLEYISRYAKNDNAPTTYLLDLGNKTIGEVFASKQKYQDQVLILQEMILEYINSRQNPNDRIPNRLGDTVVSNLSKIPDGDISRLASLIRGGFKLGSLRSDLGWNSITNLENLREKMTQAEGILKKLDREDFRDFLALIRFQGFSGATDEQFMSLDNAALIDKCFENLTEGQLKKVGLVQSLADAYCKSKGLEGKGTRERAMDGLWNFSENGIELSLNHINYRLQETDVTKIDNPNERVVWDFWKKLLHRHSGSAGFIVFDYLLDNFDKAPSLIQDGKANFAFYYQFSDYVSRLNTPEISKKLGIFLSIYGDIDDKYNSLSFLLDSEIGPEQFKDLADYLKNTNSSVSNRVYKDVFSWKSYFKDGIAQEPFIKLLATSNYLYNASDLLEKEGVLEAMPELSRNFWTKWLELPYEIKGILAKQVSNIGEITSDVIKNLEVTLAIIDQLDESPSKEIKRLKDQLIGLLLTSDDPLKAYERVKAVFERNNLPIFGKIFSVFEILYPPSKINQTMEDASASADLSPVLINSKIGSQQLRRYGIIYQDLLKVHIESANPSLYAFIKTFQEGEGLLNTLDKNGAEFFEDPANVTAKHSLERFLDRMDVLYLSSLEGKRAKADLATGDNLSDRVQKLKEKLGIREDQRISDRISDMFLKPLGYASLDQVVEKMESSKLKAHYRNVDFAREIEQQGIMKNLKEGDLVKGVDGQYFNLILENGSVAREYLGPSAGSDMTPYDTDTSMILSADLTNNLVDLIGNSLAKDYGDLMLIIRDRGQLYRTDAQNHQLVPGKYEIFNSRVHGERHFGIRTGIPSTEIDGLVAREGLLQNDAKVDRLFFDIAQKGLYIPVLNEAGELIFTPEMFQDYRIQASEVHKALVNPDFKPGDLIEALGKTEFIKNLFEAPSGVWEGYSLGQHTEMVIGQFEKYFSDFQSPLLTKNHLRIMLALHDIGKPLAFKETGSTHMQHDYTIQFLPRILASLEISPKEAELIVGMTDQDYLGDLLQGRKTPEQTAPGIKDVASKLGVPAAEFFYLIQTYYMSDAGSYTTDAGGQASLDHVFVFDSINGKNRISLSSEAQSKVEELAGLLK